MEDHNLKVTPTDLAIALLTPATYLPSSKAINNVAKRQNK
jgi:hypothetical protein